MTKRKLISLIVCIMVVVGCAFYGSTKITASAEEDEDTGDLLIGTDTEDYILPIVQEYNETDITAYGDREDLQDEEKEEIFEESYINLKVDLPDDMDVRYYFWGDNPEVPYELVILTDDLVRVSGDEYIVRLYINNAWKTLEVTDNGNGTATVKVEEVGPIAIYTPSYDTTSTIYEGGEVEEDTDGDGVPSVQSGLTSKKGSKTKGLPTQIETTTIGTSTENLETMMVPYGAYDDLTSDEWRTFKAAYDTLKPAIPDGMLARFFFWCSANESPYPMKFTMDDVTALEDVQIKMYSNGSWVDVECENNGGGTITATFTDNGPTAIFTEKK